MPSERIFDLCRACGRRDGSHALDCSAADRVARENLRADCDHRLEFGKIRTTGDPPGPLRCGRCGRRSDPGELTNEDQAEDND